MKKVTAWILLLCLCLSLAACGGKSEARETAPVQTGEAQMTEAQFTGILEDKKDFMIVVTGEDGAAYSFNLDGVTCPAEVSQKVTVTYTGDLNDFDSQLFAVKIQLAEN